MKTKTERRITCLIAAPPGLMRNALMAFLRSISRVEIVAVADDRATALTLAREHCPHVLIADASLSEAEAIKLVRQLTEEQPELNCIALTDALRQQQSFLSAGARYALLKGFLDARLKDAVLSVTESGRH